MIWVIQATSPPQFEVYQLQHADVLITEVEKRAPKQAPPTYVQGSAKTIAALAAPAKQSETDDPWETEDPWGGYQNPLKAQKKQPDVMRHDQLDAIVAQVTQRIQSTAKGQVPMDDGDTPMHEDHRFEEMEARLQHLEHTMVEHQHKQESQHVEVTTAIGHIRHQVESQCDSLQQHLDSKMAEQLQHIERLLTSRENKKHRAE